MNLKFTIGYRAEWGDCLFLHLTFSAPDGFQESTELQMTTLDGYSWTADTAPHLNRHHPYNALSYHYYVQDGGGR